MTTDKKQEKVQRQMYAKGIVLAGGSGMRLYPLTKIQSKQLLPVYNKPMIYYPISTLMLAGIRDILIITTPEDRSNFTELLGNGSDLGVNFQYAEQDHPRGLAEAFTIGSDFIGKDPVTLILGDNIFYGQGISVFLESAIKNNHGATIFGYHVKDPERYGVIEFDKKMNVVSLEEKPQKAKSSYAVTGLYIYDNDVIDIARDIQPSDRGELEITAVNQAYLKQKKLKLKLFHRGFAWLDTGTFESLLNASTFIEAIEQRQGLQVGCIEEIAWHKGWISDDQLESHAVKQSKNAYGAYLYDLLRK